MRRLEAALREVADPRRAPQMQAYMKSWMPFLGVPTPVLTRVCRECFRDLELEDEASWRAEVLGVWRVARYRELRYAAIALSRVKRFERLATLASLPMYEEMIVTGAWWDFVDVIAKFGVGGLLRRYPKEMSATMRAWSRSDHLWKRRAAILSQLTFKQDTDLALLYDTIEPAIDSKEFFLRKAIGWALREYARTNPAEVARYVHVNEARLSPLSRREALKHL